MHEHVKRPQDAVFLQHPGCQGTDQVKVPGDIAVHPFTETEMADYQVLP
jgi:hypothetical protein